jgi:hypothetical protein
VWGVSLMKRLLVSLRVSDTIRKWVRSAPCVYLVPIDIVWDSQRLEVQARSESVVLSHFDGL